MAKNILDQIIAHKRKEVVKAREAVPVRELEKSELFSSGVLSLREALMNGTGSGIIAEFKRKSPSKGVINSDAKPEVITKAYTDGGASGLSVLTDELFFGGSKHDLIQARSNRIPILRKEFVIDGYQIIEAKSMGADVILLIAACLTPGEVKALTLLAKSLHLEVLLEIHQESEIRHICDEIDIVGVNNRDLKSFTVDVNCSIGLSKKIPAGKCKISESGISDVSVIHHLREYGFHGFLIGETFMKENDPSVAFARFVHELKTGRI